MLELVLFVIVCIWVNHRISVVWGSSAPAQKVPPKTKREQEIEEVYDAYWAWCDDRGEVPMSVIQFQALANQDGKVNVHDMFKKHQQVNPESEYEYIDVDESVYETVQQKKANNQFINSAIIGYFTNSTATGAILGGNILGGMLGKHLKKKKNKK